MHNSQRPNGIYLNFTMETQLEIATNLRRLFECFIDENFVATNNVYFEKLITHMAAKENAYILQAPFVLDWVDRCINIICEDIGKLNSKVISFLFNLFSLLTKNEWIIIEIKQRRLVDKVLDIVKSQSHRLNPSIKLGIIRLMSGVCQCSLGLAYLGSMKIWQFIIEYCNQDHTLYVVREARRLLYEILYKFDVKTKDTVAVKEILEEIIKPLTDNVFVTDNEKIMVNVEDHELQHKLSSTLELLSYIFQQTLESKERTNIAYICQSEQDIEIKVWKLVEMSHNENFIRKVLTTLSSYYFAQFLYEKWNEDEQIAPHNFNEFGVSIYNEMKFCISRNYCVSFLKVAEVNHKLWKRLGSRAPKEVYIENELVRFENQLITFQLMPLHMLLRLNDIHEEEMFENYLTKIFELVCEQTLRITYTYRDSILNKPPAIIADLSLKSVYGVMSMVDILERDEAVLVFQACIYGLKEFILKLYKNDYRLCQEETYVHLKDLPSFAIVAEFANIIHAILVSMQTLIERFKITWKDSIETINLVNCVLQFLLADDLPIKIAVQALKLLQLSIEHFLSPNMALLVDDLQGSGLMVMGPIIKKRSLDPNWEVRDSILELVISIANISHIKYPTFQKFLAENWICTIVYDMATHDSEPYVRASALKCIAELVAINGIYDGDLCKQKIVEHLFEVIYNESEGIVRKEALRTLARLTKLRKIPTRYRDTYYSILAYTITNDLHWEAKVEAIQCLMFNVCNMLSDEGMIDGNFPPVTFSKEKRKIVQLTTKEIFLRFSKVLNELAQLGCLGVVIKCLREDCDVAVIRAAKALVKKMRDKMTQYNYIGSLDSEMSEAATTSRNNSTTIPAEPSTNSNGNNNPLIENVTTFNGNNYASVVKMEENKQPAEFVCADAEILEFLDSDDIIESILNSQDINLLADTYAENMNINENREMGYEANSTEANKRQVDPLYYKKFCNISVNEYLAIINRTDFEEVICKQDEWFLCPENFASLLDEILCVIKPEPDSEAISADCY